MRWRASLLLLGIALAPLVSVSGASASTPCADGGPCVEVSVVGSAQSSTEVTFAQVEAGDVSTSYAIRSQVGGDTTSSGFDGISVRDLIIDDVGIDPDSVTFVEISTSAREIATLSSDDLAEPGSPGYPFVNGLRPAIFTSGSHYVGYIQPLRNDDQPNPFFQSTEDGAVTVVVHTTGQLLHPVVTATPTTVTVGAPVGFAASFASQPATSVSYDWDFGDGTVVTGTGPTQSHSYSTAGRYAATVTARGADGSLGISNSVVVTVGAAVTATAAPTAVPGGSATATHQPTVGPTKGTGKRSGAKTSTHTSTSPVKTPKPSTATAHPTATATATPKATATPAPTVTATATSAPVAPGTDRVTGVVISGVTGAPTPAPEESTDAATAAAERSGASVGLGWGSVAALGTVALLGLGVLGETGRLGAAWARATNRLRRR